MTISASDFLSDFSWFANPAVSEYFPISMINYWLQIASIMLNPCRWPQANCPVSFATGSFNFEGIPEHGDTINLNGTVVTFGTDVALAPSLATVIANLLLFLQDNPHEDVNIPLFTYTATNSALNLQAASEGPNGNTLVISATSPYITASGVTLSGGSNGRSLLDFGTELFVAHNLVLSEQYQKAAAVGGNPGFSKGVIASEAAGGASVSYDTSSPLDPDVSHYNLTIFGSQFARLFKLVGMGPLQVGQGRFWGGLGGNPGTTPVIGNAWFGPFGGWWYGQSW